MVLGAGGWTSGFVWRSGCAPALVFSVACGGVGLRLTVNTSRAVPSAVPFRISIPLDLLIAAAFILISVIGGFISVRIISKIDPAEAIS